MRKIGFVIALVAMIGLAWFWLDRDGYTSVDENDVLGFVPHDTPYVFANLAPLPNDVVTVSLRQVDSQVSKWRGWIAQALATPDTSDANAGQESLLPSDTHAVLRAIDAELAAAPDSAALMARIGLDPFNTRFAFYGLGLVPVARITLADPAAFQALMGRMQESSGETLPPVMLAGVTAGWRIALPEVPVEAVLAIIDSQLILTVAPTENEAALRTLLGLDRPQHSLADSGALQTLNHSEGFTAWGSGFVDTAQLFAQFRTPATPLEAAFLTLLESEKPMLPASCDADVARFVQAFPRLVAGSTRMDAKHMDTLIRIETSPDLAQQLLTLRTPMPGLTGTKDAVASLGIALKVSALSDLGNQWGSATAAAPWTCPALEWINEAAAQTRMRLNNATLHMAGALFNSLLVVLDRFHFDLATQRPSDLVARLVISSDNPTNLIATARSFVPQLASLTLEPGAPPQSVPAGLLMDVIKQPAFVAMDTGTLALAIGEGQDARLPDYLHANSDTSPLFIVSYRSELMAEMVRLIREAAQSASDDERERLISNAQMIEDFYVKHYQAWEQSISLSERGIEMQQRIELKP